jgi:hypothetical protein
MNSSAVVPDKIPVARPYSSGAMHSVHDDHFWDFSPQTLPHYGFWSVMHEAYRFFDVARAALSAHRRRRQKMVAGAALAPGNSA